MYNLFEQIIYLYKGDFKLKIFKILAVICALMILAGCSANGSQTDKEQISIQGEVVKSMNDTIVIDSSKIKFLKTEDMGNPISPVIYCADPTAVEYNGRLYVYGTRDHQQYEGMGYDKNGNNTYEKIKSFIVLSTDDMVNWTYHGEIDVEAIAPWIINSWAPSIVSRVEEDGLTHFYLYFSNNGCGVGVITSTDPVGPWSDPLGRPFIDNKTEGLDRCPNPFDPGVVIDDNGVGWLSFGGGINSVDGTKLMPGSARIVKLGDDMLSFASEFAEILAPYFFEASELNYINGQYVYTCCSSWDERYAWEWDTEVPEACSMIYMTSDDPLNKDSWTQKGAYFLNPGDRKERHSNNHTHVHEYKGRYYVFHHSLKLMSLQNANGGFRSLCVDYLDVDEKNVTFEKTGYTNEGVEQISNPDTLFAIQGETFATAKNVDYIKANGENNLAVVSTEDSSCTFISKAKFKKSATEFLATVKGKGRIELRLDSLDSKPLAFIEFDAPDWQTVSNVLSDTVRGEHDVYILFSNEGIALDEWQLR